MKIILLQAAVLLAALSPLAVAAPSGAPPLIAPTDELPPCLDDREVAKLVASVDRGLLALQRLQQSEGSFASPRIGQPGITALAVMAYLSRGHVPGEGPYGATLDKAINYVLSQQKDSGIFCHTEIDHSSINRRMAMGEEFTAMITQSYNHAISMLMLGEVYGLTTEKQSFRIRQGIQKGLEFTIQLWDIRKRNQIDDGGFRYTLPALNEYDADVSITAWHAASLRSIRNAGFDVPARVMDRIAAYILRVQKPDGSIPYLPIRQSTHTMTAAGLLCLTLAGKGNEKAIEKGALSLSKFRIADPRGLTGGQSAEPHPYYACYYITQAGIQLGGRLWVSCFRQCSNFLLGCQQNDGLWPRIGYGSTYGPSYSTSMAIIALTPVLQILPIYQR